MSTSTAGKDAVHEPPPSFNPDEMFDVCTADNVVVRQERRARVHAQGLFHRSVQVVLLNPRGEVLLQRRSPTKDVAPDCWDISTSEHLQPSESYGAAAARGLYEELGLDRERAAAGLVRVVPENKYPDVGKIDREFVECWALKEYDGPVSVDNVEVVESQWMPSAQVMKFVHENPQIVAPWFADTMVRLQKAMPDVF